MWKLQARRILAGMGFGACRFSRIACCAGMQVCIEQWPV